MSTDCDLFFQPARSKDGVAVLVPVLISQDGNTRLSARKVVTSVEKCLSMYSGFTLAAAVDMAGGIEGLKDEVDSRDDDEDNEDEDDDALGGAEVKD